MKVAILTSKNQWFLNYAKSLSKCIKNSQLFLDHKLIGKEYEIVFILSYHFLIPDVFLKQHKHNIVIHSSPLPQGKGWSPMFWQILEGKNEICFSMFEANKEMDAGDIYMQRYLKLNGYELNDELREKQAKMIIQMCIDFFKNHKDIKPKKQEGVESFYPKRTAKDSELDINKSIKEQFNLLRVSNNEEYPAFFVLNGHKFILKITEEVVD
ncbi:formyltransferase domain-containing protein [Campylobacter pinnipediorum subsp. pinnipediorum]|uniref:formyltransferase family protein n=1 Tax=Campylobacter pinnipediorum TaxID=1965231 RepID=UPI000995D587|nr:formyltransferase family protein [Campylobacter pinnipediorum]AQW83959.1 formyltransferase domain-containing protein [Campylobacter pinnipediorum subsp. pinnipediorum]OPA80693.1 methionyl-tRNA formyltransferase [Campylobacter pinnipediorum subsp. pinnipediorum]